MFDLAVWNHLVRINIWMLPAKVLKSHGDILAACSQTDLMGDFMSTCSRVASFKLLGLF